MATMGPERACWGNQMDAGRSGVLIGGAVALAGAALGVVGSLLTEWIRTRKERQAYLQSKYEELSRLHLDASMWIAEFHAARGLSEVCSFKPSQDGRQALVLAWLYFPVLADPVTEYLNSLVRYYQWGLDHFDPSLPMSVGAQLTRHADSDRMSAEVMRLRVAVDLAIQRNASTFAR